jgi:hypothetical protein
LKLVIILILFTIFLALIYLRLRPYIKMARRMFSLARDVRGMSQGETTQPLRSESAADNKLVRCDACATWIPASRVVKLRSSNAAYCSHACLESSAAEGSRRKTAS